MQWTQNWNGSNTWNPQNNQTTNYKTIAGQFIDFYYSSMQTDYSSLGNVYEDGAYITLLEEEITGHSNYVTRLRSYDINSFRFNVLKWDAQPVGNDLLITTIGKVSVNGQIDSVNFSDTIYLARSNNCHFGNNSWFIRHHIFQIIGQ